MMEKDIRIMGIIQAEEDREIGQASQLPLDDEGIALAEHKRSSFDLPTNATKVDPLR